MRGDSGSVGFHRARGRTEGRREVREAERLEAPACRSTTKSSCSTRKKAPFVFSADAAPHLCQALTSTASDQDAPRRDDLPE